MSTQIQPISSDASGLDGLISSPHSGFIRAAYDVVVKAFTDSSLERPYLPAVIVLYGIFRSKRIDVEVKEGTMLFKFSDDVMSADRRLWLVAEGAIADPGKVLESKNRRIMPINDTSRYAGIVSGTELNQIPILEGRLIDQCIKSYSKFQKYVSEGKWRSLLGNDFLDRRNKIMNQLKDMGQL